MPEMRQLNDGTWLNSETGVVVAPQGFTYAGQNDVYSGPPLLPNQDIRSPNTPLPFQRQGELPVVRPPTPQQPVAGLGAMSEGVKKVLLVSGLLALTYATVTVKNKINGKKKKK